MIFFSETLSNVTIPHHYETCLYDSENGCVGFFEFRTSIEVLKNEFFQAFTLHCRENFYLSEELLIYISVIKNVDELGFTDYFFNESRQIIFSIDILYYSFDEDVEVEDYYDYIEPEPDNYGMDCDGEDCVNVEQERDDARNRLIIVASLLGVFVFILFVLIFIIVCKCYPYKR